MGSTLKPPAGEAMVEGRTRMVTLTIAFHPDGRRTGELVQLSAAGEAGSFAVSRLEPLFATPGGAAPAPLADPFVSRQPFRIDGGDDGVTIVPLAGGPEVSVDDVPLRQPLRVPWPLLERGLLLLVARRIVLRLHLREPSQAPADAMGLIGGSAALDKVRQDIRRAAALDVPVLIRGETGTGKELVARALHAHSTRARAACVTVNMATVSPTTAVSELFGHVRGAFTGASRDHEGHLVRAHRGILFLDEIGELPASVQAMLLRVLETGEVQPLGATSAERVDVRIVAATDADLEAEIAAGRFREPLLHRLAGYVIGTPPLRERPDDIAALTLHFLREELGALGKLDLIEYRPAATALWFSPAVAMALLQHGWRGNVRELRNVVRQIVAESHDRPAIDLAALRARLLGPAPPLRPGSPVSAPTTSDVAPDRAPSSIGDEELFEVLRAHRFSPAGAAAQLGISRTTLDGLIQRSTRLRKARDIGVDEIERCLAECQGDVDETAARLQISRRALQLRLKELGRSR